MKKNWHQVDGRNASTGHLRLFKFRIHFIFTKKFLITTSQWTILIPYVSARTFHLDIAVESNTYSKTMCKKNFYFHSKFLFFIVCLWNISCISSFLFFMYFNRPVIKICKPILLFVIWPISKLRSHVHGYGTILLL